MKWAYVERRPHPRPAEARVARVRVPQRQADGSSPRCTCCRSGATSPTSPTSAARSRSGTSTATSASPTIPSRRSSPASRRSTAQCPPGTDEGGRHADAARVDRPEPVRAVRRARGDRRRAGARGPDPALRHRARELSLAALRRPPAGRCDRVRRPITYTGATGCSAGAVLRNERRARGAPNGTRFPASPRTNTVSSHLSSGERCADRKAVAAPVARGRHPSEGHDAAVNPQSTVKPISDWEFEQYVQAEVDGEATPEQLAVLEADRVSWRTALLGLRRDADEHLESARAAARRGARAGDRRPRVGAAPAHRGVGAAQQPADPAAQRDRATAGERQPRARADRDERERPVDAARHGAAAGVVGSRAAWSRGPRAAARRHVDSDRLTEMLSAASAPASGWTKHEPVSVPGGARADALSIPVGEVLGLAGRGGRRSGGRRHRSERPLARAASRSGRWSSPRTARWSRCSASASAAAAARATPTARTPCAGRPRSWIATPAHAPRGEHARRRVRVRPEHRRPRADPFRAHRHGRRDLPRQRAPARAARAAATRAHGRRRLRSRHRPPRRQRVRRARAHRGRDRNARRAVGAFGHRRARTARRPPRFARRRRRVAPRGVRVRARRASSRRSSTRSSTPGRPRPPRGRDRPPRTHASRARAARRHAARPGDPEPGRSVGADDRDRRAARGGRLRRARARDVVAQAVAVVARVRRRDPGVGGRREPARERPLVGGVRRRRAHRRRRRPARQGSAAADPLRRTLGRDRQGRPRGRGRSARRTRATPRSSRAPRCCASRSASKARRCAAVSTSSAAVGPPTCSRPRPTSRRRRRAFPTGSSASCAATSAEALAWLGFLDKAGLGGCLALDMGLGKTPTMLAHLLAGAGPVPRS